MNSMMKRLVPTPSMAVALLALCVALSGTAWAATTINGKNIKNRSIAASKIKKNSLGANEIKESSIAAKMPTVPSALAASTATHADAAGSLDSLKKFGTRQGVSTAASEILNTGKLRITQECDPLGGITVLAHTAVDNASLASYGNATNVTTNDFDVLDNPRTLSTSDEYNGVVYVEPGGQTVTLQYGAFAQPGLASGGCLVSGFAITQ